MLLWALTFQTMLLQSYCQFLSRGKSPGVYVPREDLSLFPESQDEDAEVKSYRELVRPTQEYDEDYDVDKDPDIEVTKSKEDEWYQPASYRPTVGRDANSTDSKMNEDAVYEYPQDTGWPTFTIKIVTRSTPFRDTTQGKTWYELTRTVKYWGKYPLIDRNEMLKVPLLYTEEDTSSHPGRNDFTDQISQPEFSYRPLKEAYSAKFTHSANYGPLKSHINKVYSDPDPRLYFQDNYSSRKPDPIWLSEEIAPTEQDSNSPGTVEILSTTEMTSSEVLDVMGAPIPEEQNGPTSTTVITPSSATTFKQDNQWPFSTDATPTRTTTSKLNYKSTFSTVVVPTRTTTSKRDKLRQEITPQSLIAPYYRGKTILTAPPMAPDDNHEIKKITSTPKRKMPIRMKPVKVNNPSKWKCYRCGLDDAKFGDPSCYNIFQSTDESERYKRHSRKYKARCSGYSKFVGGCFKRYLDIGTDYTERGCRSWPPEKGRSYVSKRFMMLEYLLKHKREGCVVSPNAVLVTFSKTVHLYARFHVCICRGKYCNAASSHTRHNYQCLLTLYFFFYWSYRP